MTTYQYFGPRQGGCPVPRVPDRTLSADEYGRGVDMHGREIMEAWYQPTDSELHTLYREFVAGSNPTEIMIAIARCRGSDGFDFEKLRELNDERVAPKKAAKKKTTKKKAATKASDNATAGEEEA